MRPSKSITERFWPKVNKQSNGCWEWTGYINPNGYGEINLGKRGQGISSAHRQSWVIHNGEIPEGLSTLHKCDNRRCVNPEHLFLGTHQDNMDDMHMKSRGFTPFKKFKGMSHPAHILTDDSVKQIRSKFEVGVKLKQLATEYGVTFQNIHMIVKRKTWRHI